MTVKPGHETHCSLGGSSKSSCTDGSSLRIDKLLLLCGVAVFIFYGLHLLSPSPLSTIPAVEKFTSSVFELVNTMWWSVLLGVLMLSLLSKIPREFVMSVLGTNMGALGVIRATAAGVLLDLCSHGILMVAAKLYERGATIGQVMAFLIASPWNSFSLTLVLFALIGVQWTMTFIIASMSIAILAGVLFDRLVTLKILPSNPNQGRLSDDFRFWQAAKQGLSSADYSVRFFKDMLWQGVKDSRMVLRWLLFGVVLASTVRAFMPAHLFGEYFGPTMIGMVVTIIAATVMEICSEGAAPIASDLLNRASAPGNAFAFLMTGVATDYTEIMVLKDATHSWKIALFLPLLTVPQVIMVATLMNRFA